VSGHPHLTLIIVKSQLLGGDKLTAERTAGQYPTLLHAEDAHDAVFVERHIIVVHDDFPPQQ
jgi:hypothetical protein